MIKIGHFEIGSVLRYIAEFGIVIVSAEAYRRGNLTGNVIIGSKQEVTVKLLIKVLDVRDVTHGVNLGSFSPVVEVVLGILVL